jgi:hypothetical protein
MSQHVVTLNEINKVGAVYEMLSEKTHNGFPVVGKDGHLKGFIMRKHLCNLLKLKAFSTALVVPTNQCAGESNSGDENKTIISTMGDNGPTTIQLNSTASVFYDTLERNYPQYPKIKDISLTPTEMVIIVIVAFALLFCVTVYVLLEFLVGYSTVYGYRSVRY